MQCRELELVAITVQKHIEGTFDQHYLLLIYFCCLKIQNIKNTTLKHKKLEET